MAVKKKCNYCGEQEKPVSVNASPAELVKLSGFQCPKCGKWFCAKCSVETIDNGNEKQIVKSCPFCDQGKKKPEQTIDEDIKFAGKNKDLFKAALENRESRFRSLLIRASNLDAQEKLTGYTILIFAVKLNHISMLQLLLSKGVNINHPDNREMSALMWSSIENLTRIIEILLKKNANIEQRDNKGRTALLWACAACNVKAVDILLKFGANVNAPDNDGVLPIMYAVKDTSDERKEILIADNKMHGANKNQNFRNDNQTNRLAIVKLLIENGAKLDIFDNNSASVLMYALNNDKTDYLELLLKNGANPNESNSKGFTILMYAAYKHYHNTMKILIEHGADINDSDNLENTALILTTSKGFEDETRYLLEQGADVNLKNAEGLTALFFAAYKNHYNCVRLLLEHNSDANALDAEDKNAIWWIIDKIGDRGKDVVNLLIDHKIDINNSDSKSETLLMHSIVKKCPEIANILINSQAEINLKNNHDETALMFACLKGYYSLVKKLIELGADIHVHNKKNKTAMNYAIRGKQKKIIALLEEIGAMQKKCFVATTVYQNENHPDVIKLRSWRDLYLKQKKYGRYFIKWYYKNGYSLAKIVQNIPILKTFTYKTLKTFVKYFLKNI